MKKVIKSNICITQNIPLFRCIQILLQIYGSFYLLKTMYPGYFNIMNQYFTNCKEHVSLSKYIYYIDKIMNQPSENKIINITLLNMPVVLYLIHQFESNKIKDKRLKENANMLYQWSTEFTTRKNK